MIVGTDWYKFITQFMTTSQSSGYLIVNSNTNSGSYYGVSQNVTTTTGTEYMLSFDIVSGGTGNGAVRVADGNTATHVLSTTGGLGVGSYSFTFVNFSILFNRFFLEGMLHQIMEQIELFIMTILLLEK